MKGEDTATLADDAYGIVHRAIRSGKLVPGQRLRFSELQALCGMSVSPVREALVRLTAEGFTQADSHRGYRVAPLSVAELNDIVANRKLLEGEALRLSMLRGDAEWESRMIAAHHLLSRLKRERDDIPSALRDEWEERHIVFHRALVAACGSPILIELCEALRMQAERYRRLSVGVTCIRRDAEQEHRLILDLAIERKSEAIQALQDHFQKTADAAMIAFGGKPEP